jgi:hypothetical protein
MSHHTAAITLVLTLSACLGDRDPPLSGGPGILVTGTSPERVVAVDPARVPVLDACPAGQAVLKTTDGWACGTLMVVEQGELARLTAAAERAQAAVAPLSDGQASLDARITRLERSPPYGTAAIACTPDIAAIREAKAFQQGGKIVHVATGAFNVFCPVVATSPRVSWTRLRALYRDADGAGSASQVRVALRQLLRRGTSTEPTTIAELDSNGFDDREATEHDVPVTHAFDFESAYYYVQVSLQQTQTATQAFFGGFRID